MYLPVFEINFAVLWLKIISCSVLNRISLAVRVHTRSRPISNSHVKRILIYFLSLINTSKTLGEQMMCFGFGLDMNAFVFFFDDI